jgi:hypothetical protein
MGVVGHQRPSNTLVTEFNGLSLTAGIEPVETAAGSVTGR